MSQTSFTNLNQQIEAAQAGNLVAMANLLEAYRTYLMLLARLQIDRSIQGRLSASDVVQDTFLQAKRYFDFDALAPTRVKGKVEPVRVYRVISIKRQSMATKGLVGIETKTIGRDAELQSLQNTYHDSAADADRTFLGFDEHRAADDALGDKTHDHDAHQRGCWIDQAHAPTEKSRSEFDDRSDREHHERHHTRHAVGRYEAGNNLARELDEQRHDHGGQYCADELTTELSNYVLHR